MHFKGTIKMCKMALFNGTTGTSLINIGIVRIMGHFLKQGKQKWVSILVDAQFLLITLPLNKSNASHRTEKKTSF